MTEATETGFHYERETIEVENKNGLGKFKYDIEYKEFDTFEALHNHVGGDAGLLNLGNSVYKTRSKSAGTTPVKNAAKDADMEKTIENAQNGSKSYQYTERGIGAQTRVKRIDELKEKIKSGELNLRELSAEEIEAIMLAM